MLLDVIRSRIDKTTKYIFKLEDNLIIEVAYINKDDGKDIICVPSQTGCNLQCRFCHLSEIHDKIINRNIKSEELLNCLKYVVNDLNLYENKRTLLVSYMGCGEPLMNNKGILENMMQSKSYFEKSGIPFVRFAIATSLPKYCELNFFELASNIKKYELPVKIHLSLHFTSDTMRHEWMPKALEILPSINALEYYMNFTKNSVEIHYALVDDVNDSTNDIESLTKILNNRNIPVKFLFYNEKPNLDYHASPKEKLKLFEKSFKLNNIDFEYYIPPGLDIGASCGQFLLDYYLKYNKKEP